jgi:hypothetical protein
LLPATIKAPVTDIPRLTIIPPTTPTIGPNTSPTEAWIIEKALNMNAMAVYVAVTGRPILINRVLKMPKAIKIVPNVFIYPPPF